jgi:hypothetical protein
MNFTVNQSSSNRWANVLDAISRGLGIMAASHAKREEEEAHEQHEDARDAARNAFAENMARFQASKESERQQAMIDAEAARQHESIDAQNARDEADRLSREKIEGAQLDEARRYHASSLGLEGKRLANEEERTRLQDERDAARDKKAESTDAKNRAAEAQRATQSAIDSLQRDRSALIDAAKLDPTGLVTDEQKADFKKQLDAIDAQIHDYRKDLGRLSTSSGFEPEASRKETEQQVGSLPPDRQKVYEAILGDPNNKKSSREILDNVKRAPQSMIDQAMQEVPSADTGGAPEQPGAFMEGGDVTGLASTQPQDQSMQPAQQQAGQTDQLAQVDVSDQNQEPSAVEAAGTEDDTTSNEQDRQEQYAGVAQQLEQSPTGQGIHSTLDRLAEATNNVQADKLRRQAQIQLQDQLPDDIDSNDYIDWYLQQQQQEPAYS